MHSSIVVVFVEGHWLHKSSLLYLALVIVEQFE